MSTVHSSGQNAATGSIRRKPEPVTAEPKDFLDSLPAHLPSPPFIHVPGIANFRDCGGYECAPPPDADLTIGARYMVRRGVLFRCAFPNNVTPAGAAKLRDQLGITDIFDLRSQPELQKLAASAAAAAADSGGSRAGQESPATATDADEDKLDTSQGFVVVPGVSRTFTPVYAEEDYSPPALARKMLWYGAADAQGKDYSEGFVKAYRDIATYAAHGGAYATILRQLLRTVQETQRAEERRQQRQRDRLAKARNGSQRPSSVLANIEGIEAWREYANKDENDGDGDGDNTNGTRNDGGGNRDGIKRDGGVVFHCTAGKDRTGVLAAVVLKLCGVPDHVIQWEYAITEPGLGDWRSGYIDRISRSSSSSSSSGTNKNSNNAGGGGGLSRAEAARICSSRASNIRAWMEQVLEGEFGGAERYLSDKVGLSAREINGLKRGLVVEVAQDSDLVEPVDIPGWSMEAGMDEDNDDNHHL